MYLRWQSVQTHLVEWKYSISCRDLGIIKGSNMIVCVLLASNSRGCSLAAPGDDEGVARMSDHPTSSATRGDNKVDHAVCLKVEFHMHTVLTNEMASSTQLWWVRASARRHIFRWDRLLDACLAFVQAGVPSGPDDVTLRSCANTNVMSQM